MNSKINRLKNIENKINSDFKNLHSLFKDGKIKPNPKIRIFTEDAMHLLRLAKVFQLPESTEASRVFATAAAHEQQNLTKKFESNLIENTKLEITPERKKEYAECLYHKTLIRESELDLLMDESDGKIPSNFDPHKLRDLFQKHTRTSLLQTSVL